MNSDLWRWGNPVGCEQVQGCAVCGWCCAENIGFSKYFALGVLIGREPFVSGIRAATLFAGVHAGNRWDSKQSIKKIRHSPQKHTHIHPTPELAVYFLVVLPGNTNQREGNEGATTTLLMKM